MTLPVRPARESDMAFVAMSWRASFEPRHAFDREEFREEMDRVIRRLCSRGHVRIAHAPDDDDHLIGFAAYSADGRELHYIYVKQDFRGKGIARALLKDASIATYSFLAPTARPRKGWLHTPRYSI